MQQSYENIKQVIHLDRNEYLIRYRFTYACNYRCKGCYQDIHRTEEFVPTAEHIVKVSQKINQLLAALQKDKPVTLFIEGGEFSIYDIKNLILRHIDLTNVSTLKLITNLSAPLNYYQSIVTLCQQHDVRLRLQTSFHLSQCNPEEYFEKIALLPIQTVIVGITEQNLIQYEPYLQYMLDNSILFVVNAWRGESPVSEQLQAEVMKWNNLSGIKSYKIVYKDNSEELVNAREVALFWNKIKFGARCTKFRNLCITPDGSVSFICTEKAPLGNILDIDDFTSIAHKMQRTTICTAKYYCNHNCGGMDITIDD